MNIDEVKDRYRNDHVFKKITDTLGLLLDQHAGVLTPTDLRAATMLACTMHAERHVLPLLLDPPHYRRRETPAETAQRLADEHPEHPELQTFADNVKKAYES